MRVLVACEFSGRVRDAFARKGHYAVSVDLLPTEKPGRHHQGDVRKYIKDRPRWDLVIAFPPCTYLAAIGAAHWPQRIQDGLQEEAIHFFLDMWCIRSPKVVIENPVGCMSTLWRKPDQYVEPWWFGDPWRKKTGLWFRGVEPLYATDVVTPQGHWVDGGTMRAKGLTRYDEGSYVPSQAVQAKHANQQRAHARAATFKGLANAMAEQWG